jgi:hemerythrin superfamily protein
MEDVTRGMGEMFGMGAGDPTKMLHEDHEKVKDLFGQFERSTDQKKRGDIFADIQKNLNAHIAIEEEIFYPAAKQTISNPQLIDQAMQEHARAKMEVSQIASAMGMTETSQMMGRPEMTGRPEDRSMWTEQQRRDAGSQFTGSGAWVSGEQAMSGYEPRPDVTEPGMREQMPQGGMTGQPMTGQPGMPMSGSPMDMMQTLKNDLLMHIQMEESQMFPEVKQAIPQDKLDDIGRRMMQRKHDLM